MERIIMRNIFQVCSHLRLFNKNNAPFLRGGLSMYLDVQGLWGDDIPQDRVLCVVLMIWENRFWNQEVQKANVTKPVRFWLDRKCWTLKLGVKESPN